MTDTKKWPWDLPTTSELVRTETARSRTTEPRLFTYCRDLGITPAISPGLDPAGPSPDGEDTPNVADVESGGRYVLGPELGRGGGGVVYLATDRSLRRSVAIKVLMPDLVGQPDRVQAFVEEAIITGGLEHPNIVPAYDLGVSQSLGIYYTMKRLTGRPLAAVLEGLRLCDPATVQGFGMFRLIGCFTELCRALAYAHSRGILHCDLKPENVFIGEYGEVVVVDWGLAQVLSPEGRRQARANMKAGTPEYMAPEQITKSGHDLDVRSDIWALGVILYEILTLTVPFKGATPKEILMRVMVEPLEPPAQRAPGRPISPGIEDICRRALSKNRDLRYGSVLELLADLEAELEGTREQLRRADQSRRAMEVSEAILERLRTREEAFDALFTVPDGDGETSGDSSLLHVAELRRALLAGYAEAAGVILRGIDAAGGGRTLASRPAVPDLCEAAGDLYWRIFRRVWPSYDASEASFPRSFHDQANDILVQLSERAIAAVVRVGRSLAQNLDHGVRGRTEASGDPWLSIVAAMCRTDSVVPSLATTSSGLRSLVHRITFLQQISLFAAVPTWHLLPIAEACREVNYGPEALIFGQGDPGDSLCLVLEGSVEVIRDGAVINRLGVGEVLGEISVLGTSPRTASVMAVDAVRVLVLEAEKFRRIVRENGDIGLAVIQVISERLRVATERESALRALTRTILAKRHST